MKHFLDIGANIGQTFDWYLLKTTQYDGYHIWCLEPSPRHISQLRQRCIEIMENNTHNFKITVCPFGLSNRTESVPIYETVDSLGDSILPTGHDSKILTMCSVMNAADFIFQNIHPEDRIVAKIDVEGSELKILDSILDCHYVSLQIDKILVELHASTETLSASTMERIRLKGIEFEQWTL